MMWDTTWTICKLIDSAVTTYLLLGEIYTGKTKRVTNLHNKPSLLQNIGMNSEAGSKIENLKLIIRYQCHVAYY